MLDREWVSLISDRQREGEKLWLVRELVQGNDGRSYTYNVSRGVEMGVCPTPRANKRDASPLWETPPIIPRKRRLRCVEHVDRLLWKRAVETSLVRLPRGLQKSLPPLASCRPHQLLGDSLPLRCCASGPPGSNPREISPNGSPTWGGCLLEHASAGAPVNQYRSRISPGLFPRIGLFGVHTAYR